MPIDFQDILAENARQEQRNAQFLQSPLPQGNVGGALGGLGQALAGWSWLNKDQDTLRKAKEDAAVFSGLQKTSMEVAIQNARLQGVEQTYQNDKAKRLRAQQAAKSYIYAGQNPLDFLPEQDIEASGIPIRLGPALLDQQGNVIKQDRQVVSIGDMFRDVIDRLPNNEAKLKVLSMQKDPATDEAQKDFRDALREAAGILERKDRDYSGPARDPNVDYNTARSTRLNALRGLSVTDPDDIETRNNYINIINSAAADQRRLGTRIGMSKDEILGIKDISPEEAKDINPKNPAGIGAWLKGAFQSLTTPVGSSEPPIANSATSARRVGSPPAVASSAPPPGKPAIAPYPKKSAGESDMRYLQRIAKNLSEEEAKAAIKQEFPDSPLAK